MFTKQLAITLRSFRQLGLAGLLSLGLVLSTSAFPAQAAPGPVCTVAASGADYTTLTAALADTNCSTIEVAPGTYMENLTIERDVTIHGPATGSAILDGAQAGSVIYIKNTSSFYPTVIISRLTIRNGKSKEGGGIHNHGMLTLRDSTVSANSSETGGGIENDHTLDLSNSTISGNSATEGGGIRNEDTITVTFSTVATNTATTGAGIENTTGEGVENTGNVATLRDTIVAANNGGNCTGIITDGGYNLDDGTSCSFSTANHSINTADPLLGPLQNNGGPTPTMALQTGSPAIDKIPVGVNGCGTVVTIDQREVVRPQGTACDIGAFEWSQQTPPPPPPPPPEGMHLYLPAMFTIVPPPWQGP